ncbi:MAG TPA: NAD(P)H-dependent oxidoreductase subunit E [Thermoanaerobaculia bacterium]|nr:NAD(P)H-dependent oxidoreductase subunit E [Thermoanaerobaculia bacterium]
MSATAEQTASVAELALAELPDAAKAEIAEIRKRYPTAQAALLPALHIAQRNFDGWLAEPVIAAVAAELGLPVSTVYGVVTFYDLYHLKPVGRHRIRVCNNLSCQLRGAEEILDAMRAELGVGEDEVTDDGRCSYVHFECLGSCDTAPMMMIDDDYHENLTPESAREIVRGLK